MKPNKRSSNLNTRRKSALKRLEEQLKSNKKPLESARLSDKILIDLTESDIKRIEKEILTLKTKIK